jgi:hypothetical protein
MHSQSLLLALLSTTASAANIYRRSDCINTNNTQPVWTITSFQRTCNADDTECRYVYGIDTGGDGVSGHCDYTVSGAPASRAEVFNQGCSDGFVASSRWSGQFGDANGFTTFAVTNNVRIVWPAYADSRIAGGAVVVPDQSYVTYTL